MISPYVITNFLLDTLLDYQVSDPREYLTRFDDHAHLEVGGFQDSAGTHFSRLKDSRQLIQVGERFAVFAKIYLPFDFYEKQESSLKLVTVGQENPYRRMGLWIDSDGYPRLQAETKPQPLKKLWQGTQKIPTGSSYIELEFVPSPIDGKALTRFYRNGGLWGESTDGNFIAGESGYVVNRMVWGLDGAAGQDTSRIAMEIYEVGIYVPRPLNVSIEIAL